MAQTLAALAALRGWRLFALLLGVTVLVRAPTFGNPVIGFDEQFYLLVGDRMLAGALPYVDIFDRKPVGLFVLYALIAALPIDATLAYQAVAAMFVAGTAVAIVTLARGRAQPLAALCSGIAYILWLNFVEGEGGQSPVFYNLPMVGAAMLVASAVRTRRAIPTHGSAAMLLVGVALQIKYSAVFEGMVFGVVLVWVAWRAGTPPAALAARAALWAGIALLPTAAAALTYAAGGHFDAWFFANFVSLGGKLADPAATAIEGLATIGAILLPLAAFVRIDGRAVGFEGAWLAVAVAGMIAFGAFASPHYAMPVLVPLTIVAATGFGRHPRAAVAVLLLGLVGGQTVLAVTRWQKGGPAEAGALADAARPRHGGCVYVYDGYPALYRLTDSCLPTRWVFPGHLNTANEASRAALGVDPSVEVARILASRPEAIVIDLPLFERGNRATWRLVSTALDRTYTRIKDVRTGSNRHRQVYRRRDTLI